MYEFEGMATAENLSTIALSILNKLDRKTYTFVRTHRDKNFLPQIRTHQKLKEENGCPLASIHTDKKTANFCFWDTSGIWEISTNDSPHIVIDANTIIVTWRNLDGLSAHWQITVE